LTEISPSSSAKGLKKVREKQHCHEKINTACNHFKPQSPVLENLYTHSSAHHSLHCYPPPKHTHTHFSRHIYLTSLMEKSSSRDEQEENDGEKGKDPQ
jgi:hypothetical protein